MLGSKKDVVDLVWSGDNKVFSAGRDGSIGILDLNTGSNSVIKKHHHWVNCLALNSSTLLRSGPFHAKKSPNPPDTFAEAIDLARGHFDDFMSHIGAEVLASGS